MDFLRQSDEVLSIGEFTRRFKMIVKTQIPELWLRGEISNLKTYSSGHTYFTLKDENASISAVLFKGNARNISFPLREGMKILVYGEVDVFETRGTYQILVRAALPDGIGDLTKRFEALKQKLSEEGLFDKSRKKAIPSLPRNIAVITSPTGAAIQDFCRILTRRNWKGNVFILPARVQGAESASEIVQQINFAQNSGFNFDLIVLMRGGGSLEDLWSFNEEIVARTVASSEIPIISAVGHEIDFTLSDFAADLRAETPSAAAELISSSFLNFVDSIEHTSSLISRALRARLQEVVSLIKRAKDVLRLNSPKSKIENASIRLDDLDARIKNAFSENILRRKILLSSVSERLKSVSVQKRVEILRAHLDAMQQRLQALSVDSILKRGFAIVRKDNEIVSAENLHENDIVSITFADGKKSAKITK